MSLLASPLESVESAVIWLLVGFSVVTWGLALVKVAQFVRLKNQDKRFHKQFWLPPAWTRPLNSAMSCPGRLLALPSPATPRLPLAIPRPTT